jgi:hypothetical protein
MIQYQAIEETASLVDSGEASATLGDRKCEDFGSSLQRNFIDFFQRFPDIIGTTVHNEVVDSTENDGPCVQGFGSFVYSPVS